MNKIYIIILLLLSCCSYPDIDTVPKFNNVSITEKNSIDLCNLSNTDNDNMKCRFLEK